MSFMPEDMGDLDTGVNCVVDPPEDDDEDAGITSFEGDDYADGDKEDDDDEEGEDDED